MILGRVIGEIHGTIKHSFYEAKKMLVVEKTSPSGAPTGDYLIAAGSDDDGDLFICGPGDLYCGFYPTLDEPELVTKLEGVARTGLNFTVSTSFQGTGAGPFPGFARLE